jgi:hypothetical protein
MNGRLEDIEKRLQSLEERHAQDMRLVQQTLAELSERKPRSFFEAILGGVIASLTTLGLLLLAIYIAHRAHAFEESSRAGVTKVKSELFSKKDAMKRWSSGPLARARFGGDCDLAESELKASSPPALIETSFESM